MDPKFNLSVRDQDRTPNEVRIKVEIVIEGTLRLDPENELVSMDFDTMKGAEMIHVIDEEDEILKEVKKEREESMNLKRNLKMMVILWSS